MVLDKAKSSSHYEPFDTWCQVACTVAIFAILYALSIKVRLAKSTSLVAMLSKRIDEA